jgi:hypothetical protein
MTPALSWTLGDPQAYVVRFRDSQLSLAVTVTNLPVRSRSDAIEKLEWYALRWKNETFHMVLKSGCRPRTRSCGRPTAWRI